MGTGKNLGPDKDLGPDKNLVPNVSGGWGWGGGGVGVDYHHTNAHYGPIPQVFPTGPSVAISIVN